MVCAACFVAAMYVVCLIYNHVIVISTYTHLPTLPLDPNSGGVPYDVGTNELGEKKWKVIFCAG